MTRLLLYAAGVCAVSLAGGGLILLRSWHPRILSLFVSFGAGVILSTALLHLMPSSIQSASPLWILAGFLFIFLGENFIMMHGCVDDDCDVHHAGVSAFAGLSVHAVAAGIAIGAGSLFSVKLGLVAFWAILIHKAPESLSLACILARAGYTRAKTGALILLYSLLTPAGAILSFLLLRPSHERIVTAALAFSAGTFFEVAAGDLLPQVHRPGPMRLVRTLTFLGGIALVVLFGDFHH